MAAKIGHGEGPATKVALIRLLLHRIAKKSSFFVFLFRLSKYSWVGYGPIVRFLKSYDAI